jgi:dihydrofolate synthase/folylpolyglutamate synthase
MFIPHWPKNINYQQYENSVMKLLKILPSFNNPHLKTPPVIHVAGTNGKGSTIAFLQSILHKMGKKTHIYTSPHIFDCNERIKINSQKISDQYLTEIIEEIRIKSQGVILSLFEALTLAAILVFSRHPADFCLIETGVGGRVDATNVIENKITTILTSISLDHEDLLGRNITQIAKEKSCIIRKGVPVFSAYCDNKVAREIDYRAGFLGSELSFIGKDIFYEIHDNSFDLRYKDFEFKNLPKPKLLGNHQIENAILAIISICNIFPNVSRETIYKGLIKVEWNFRIEKINNGLNKFLKNPASEIWFDCAHNFDGAKKLADWLTNQDKVMNFLIVGFTKEKSKKEFFIPFKNLIEEFLPLRVEGEPNPEEKEVIAKIIKEVGLRYKTQEDLLEAVFYSAKKAGQNKCRIIICGSIYLARDLKKYAYVCK